MCPGCFGMSPVTARHPLLFPCHRHTHARTHTSSSSSVRQNATTHKLSSLHHAVIALWGCVCGCLCGWAVDVLQRPWRQVEKSLCWLVTGSGSTVAFPSSDRQTGTLYILRAPALSCHVVCPAAAVQRAARPLACVHSKQR